jgi:ABC-type multidrug transport system fused ATPase/permease subunit
LRKRLIAHQLGLTLRWYGSRGVGDLLSVSDVDTRQATFVLAPLPFATGVSALLVGSVAVITITDRWLGALALLLLVSVVGLDLRGSWLTFEAMEEAQRRRGRSPRWPTSPSTGRSRSRRSAARTRRPTGSGGARTTSPTSSSRRPGLDRATGR